MIKVFYWQIYIWSIVYFSLLCLVIFFFRKLRMLWLLLMASASPVILKSVRVFFFSFLAFVIICWHATFITKNTVFLAFPEIWENYCLRGKNVYFEVHLPLFLERLTFRVGSQGKQVPIGSLFSFVIISLMYKVSRPWGYVVDCWRWIMEEQKVLTVTCDPGTCQTVLPLNFPRQGAHPPLGSLFYMPTRQNLIVTRFFGRMTACDIKKLWSLLN